MMTKEDIMFARAHKEWEIENHTDTLNECEIDDIIESESAENVAEKDEESILAASNLAVLTCSSCGVLLSDCSLAVKEISEEESSMAWKRAAQQEGISIEYRCPRCRSCNDCRRSFATERVSIREEAEDQMIYDSVHLDWENKRILCTLPMRGSEEEFLSNNRDIACSDPATA